jgi:DNA-binding transcriptional ArsR family regulator
VESVFEFVAEPNRRAMMSRLGSSQQSVGAIERQLRKPKPTVSRRQRFLRHAGFVESAVDAQRRLYRLKPEPLQKVNAWSATFRRFRSAHVDALEGQPQHGSINSDEKEREGKDDAAQPRT